MDLSLVLLVLALIPGGLRLPGVDAKTRAPKEPPITALPRQFHEDHRLLPWCVNGIDEPEFKKYPWNEFVPILQRRYFVDNVEANQRYAYSTHMYPIQINMTGTPPGSGGSLYQRGHFVLKTSLRKEFATNVQLQYNFTKIEGLIVQANFAPYGVGLPMGTFVHPKLFNCVDCRKPVGIPIACRRRTHMHIMHPTIMAYHHKMKIPQEEKDRQKSYCYAQLIPSQCIIIDFKNTTNNVTGLTLVYKWDKLYDKYKPLPGMATPCQTDADCNGDKDNPTGPLIQSWFDSDCCPTKDNGKCNLTATTSGPATKVKKHCPNFAAATTDEILENPREQSEMYPVFKCKPFETTVCRPVGFPKVPRYETKDSFQTDYTISTAPAIPSGPAGEPGFDPFDDKQTCCLGASPSPAACPAPPPSAPPGPPPGQIRCPQADPAKGIANTECVKRVVLPVDKDDEPDWSWNTAPKDEEKKCDDLLNEDEYGTSNEIHGNFVWYTPPCRPNNILVSFQMLIVHNFQKGLYAIQTSEPFKLKAGETSGANINAHIPTPLFTGFPHFCDTPVDSPSYLYERPDQTPFDFSRSYDACVQNITGTKYVNEQVCPGRVPLFTPSTGKKKRGGKPATYKSDIPKCESKNPDGTYLPCVTNTCPELPKTTPEYVATPGKGILKRTLHGGINIITNFCIMPICVFIARFYKETYNMQSFKGQKTWYWMHMLGAGGSTLFMYMGYFTDKLVDTSDAHLVYGNLYIICLGLSYMTAWIRHKNRWISMIVESIHSCCGYGCFILALICVTNAKQHEEPISDEVKYVVYVAIASLTIFYVGMTIHICSMDRKFGMKPKRWHFPSVESRFDDLPVPGRNIRKIFIFAVLFINLPLTLSTLFL